MPLKIHKDSQNKCIICNNKFTWMKIFNKVDDNLYEIRYVNSHAKCRRIYDEYIKSRINYEWLTFFNNLD